jgi:hypothetical protein
VADQLAIGLYFWRPIEKVLRVMSLV